MYVSFDMPFSNHLLRECSKVSEIYNVNRQVPASLELMGFFTSCILHRLTSGYQQVSLANAAAGFASKL